ncbi:UNVERIFIED_CONTAM: hypothetical protein GTU68_029055 [Idotea baltica]|nr:hypothetical protein [Idotea baltica]
MQRLQSILQYHEWRYYVKSDPVISDYDYDLLFKELQKLEVDHPEWIQLDSPTQRVARGLSTDFPSVEHLAPMLSLDNSYNAEDLADFDERLRKITEEHVIKYCVEPKFDGASIALVYENDQLVRAATRGNGAVGDDITNNAKVIRSIPLSAKFSQYGIAKIEIRGEVVIEDTVFAQLNRSEGKKELDLFKHSRNTASGALRMKDPNQTAQRGLEAFIYQIGYAIDTDGKHSNIELLNTLGFKTPTEERGLFDHITAVSDFVANWEVKRNDYNYEIDGMVVKVDDIRLQEMSGSTAHHPRWAIAYKFKAKQANTRLLNIEYQVGRTGAITPVAKLDPVQLTGVTIQSVSLHNEEMIQEKDIRIGDIVVVERAGDVIPYIVGPVADVRDGSEKKVIFPTNCPSCIHELVKSESESIWRCENFECNAQIEERLIHFVSKGAMNIDGLGKDIVKRFIKEGFLLRIPDVYQLDFDKIAAINGWKEKSVQNLKQNIEASKNQDLWRVMVALGIRHVGSTTAKMLAKRVESIFDFQNWTQEQLLELNDVGPKVAESIIGFFSDPVKIALLQHLEKLGVNLLRPEEEGSERSNILEGQTFLFTGSLQLMKRDQAKELVESNGGKLISSVSKNLTFLVAGEKAGSKLKKAEAIESIQIIDEATFLEMIGKG